MSDFGNIGILTSLSTLILKIIVAKLSSCAKVEFGDFHYDVIVQMRVFSPLKIPNLKETEILLNHY